MIFAQAVLALAPGAEFAATDAEIIAWHSPDIEQPSAEAIAAKVAELAAAPDAPDAQPSDTISRFQARAVLLNAGLLTQVEQVVANADDMTRLAWAEAVEWKRSSPTINSLGAQLGLSDAQMDALFAAAAQIEV